VLEATNDIGFAAVRIGAGQTPPDDVHSTGVYFRMLLGGITGHGTFAQDSGVLLEPRELVPAAVAVIRTFIAHGDRTDRKRARLKYLIERWGIEKFLLEAAAELPAPWRRVPLDACEPRLPAAKHGHVGVHAQAQRGFYYIGVVLPVGRLRAAQLQVLADIAERYGSSALRLTVWQNLLISDIPEAALPAAVGEIEAIGLGVAASAVRGGLVACTGNAGCKFALSDTKRHALTLAEHLEARLALDRPINIHLTGCPNSCAQHYVGDIGLLATKVDRGDDEVEGYHVLIGGGSGAETALGREICAAVPADEMPARIEAILCAYLARRFPEESFHAFANRHTVEELAAIFGGGGAVQG
jgi:ferredoxin-nitrite reductase